MSKKILLSVGHGRNASGGYDPGALSRDGNYEEHKIAREIAKYASEYLGCRLMNYDGTLCLGDRIKEVNAIMPDFCADIHLNAGGGTGTETFYFHGSPTGKKAAKAISRNIAEAFSCRDRGAKTKLNSQGKDYFGYIRQTKPCAVLIETLFIDSSSDLEKIKTESGMKKCGEAIGRALEEIFGDNRKFTADRAYEIRGGAGTEYAVAGKLKKGETVTLTVTSYDGKWARLGDGRGWIKKEK